MQLWTEYEGRTIEGSYTLGKLLRSEGRNGFFSTSDKTGNSAVIRLTEAHYDEDELLKRWRQVATMHQDNLIEIERVGQTNFDGVPITYALMEPNDANLGDVLRERPLTATEATQVAKSVLAAICALHNSGMVHEHIEASNVLAVGETVKLRSDCVRECMPDGTEFNTPEGCAELRRKDIHDFGMLMLQCLTLEKQFSPRMNLPAPFNRVVPAAIEGTWSLEQISAVLDPAGFAPKPVAPPTAAKPAQQPTAGAKAPTKLEEPAAAARIKSVQPEPPQQATLPLPGLREQKAEEDRRAEPAIGVRRDRVPVEEDAPQFSLRPVWILCLAAAILAILVGWHFVGSKPVKPAVATQDAAPITSTRAPRPVAAAPVAARRVELPAAAAPLAHAAGWYVIAYTYNHQAQAQAKADKVNAKRHGLHATVFSPRGGTYLVSVGGPMSEPEAKALQSRARRSGMPRDTYIRNFR